MFSRKRQSISITLRWLVASGMILSMSSVLLGQNNFPPVGSIPSGLAPNSFPMTDPLQVPPPPLSNNGPIDLSSPAHLSTTTPAISSSTSTEPVVHWYYPWTWFPTDGWVNSAELGINGSDGNSESFSFQTGARFKRKGPRNLFELRMTHNRTQANGTETQNNALLFADHEFLFADSPFSWFNKLGLEYDEFKAFDVRLNLNTGLGYRWIDTEALRFATRFGSGTSREFGGPDDRWVPEAVFGFDYDHQVNKRHKLIAKVDYFPEWSDFANYRVVADTGWEYLLSEDGNLSLKLGANDRYDSTPNGRKPNDLNYTFLLLYKF